MQGGLGSHVHRPGPWELRVKVEFSTCAHNDLDLDIFGWIWLSVAILAQVWLQLIAINALRQAVAFQWIGLCWLLGGNAQLSPAASSYWNTSDPSILESLVPQPIRHVPYAVHLWELWRT